MNSPALNYSGVDSDPVSAFHSEMIDAGIVSDETPIADGELHRFRVAGDKSGSRNGWYILFGDSNPNGCFGSWKLDINETWSQKNYKEFTQQEKDEYAKQMAQVKEERRKIEAKRHKEARAEAERLWGKAKEETGSHQYLKDKGVQAHRIRTNGSKLLVPLRDSTSVLHSIQFIDQNGKKLFLSGGTIQGNYFSIGRPKDKLIIAEGYSTGASIYQATGHAVVIAFDAGNLLSVAKALREKFPDIEIIIAGDNDTWNEVNVGKDKATEAEKAVNGKLVIPEFLNTETKPTDFNDLATLEGLETVKEQINSDLSVNDIWPAITPLNTNLPPVEPFNYKLLPDGLSEWVKDIVDRTQCPPDFIAVTVMVSLASLVGRKVAIHPKEHDDWLVTPNLWGTLIGRPSAMKSPAMAEGLRPLKRLAKEAHEQFKNEIEEYGVEKAFSKQRSILMENEIKSALKDGDQKNIDKVKYRAIESAKEEQQQPTQHRYIVNDATIEKLGELLNQNPNGLLLVRDELTGWLKNLDKEDRANDRAFYLEAFNGGGNYIYDRIGRGTLHIESTTVSLIGGLQPSKLRPYVYQAINYGNGDDGLIQRFQLAVYPDDMGKWVNVDRWPYSNLRNGAFEIFKRLDEMEAQPFDDEGRVVGVRFDEAGQRVFNAWREELEIKIKDPVIHPAIESHLTKYRSLMPSIALVINEVEEGHCKKVTEQSARKASAWCQYLESHMHRIYGGAIDPVAQSAALILSRRDNLTDGFTQRIVKRKGWVGLAETEYVRKSLDELVESGYLREVQSEKTSGGGRPTSTYFWNPAIGS